MYHDKVQCGIQSAYYYFNKKVGTLVMDDGDCCDMSGCIALFIAIDPDVKRIVTISGTEPDTKYVRTSSRWIANRS